MILEIEEHICLWVEFFGKKTNYLKLKLYLMIPMYMSDDRNLKYTNLTWGGDNGVYDAYHGPHQWHKALNGQ